LAHFVSRTLVSFAPRKVTLVTVSVPTSNGLVLVHDPSRLRFHSAQLSVSALPWTSTVSTFSSCATAAPHIAMKIHNSAVTRSIGFALA